MKKNNSKRSSHGRSEGSTNYEEGKDYMILQRYRIMDQYGLSQPVEAISFLLPAIWQVNSDIQWDGRKKCIPEMLQASMNARSPNGNFELTMYPATQFDWSDDPVYLDAMQRGFNMHSCYISRPLDAAGYINRSLAPAINAQVKSAAVIEALQNNMDEQAMAMTNEARRAGNYAYTHRGSAAEGELLFEDGKQGLAYCTLMQTIVTIGGTQGGMVSSYYCYASVRMVLKFNPGDEEMARKIMSTLFSSARINPIWENAVKQFFINVGTGAQNELWKQVQISHQAQQEISDNIIRGWEARNKSNTTNNSGEYNTNQFSQYLRGVESYTDENGNQIELTSGYSNAWSKGDGSYLLSNNTAFDPNVELGGTQSWGRLKQ